MNHKSNLKIKECVGRLHIFNLELFKKATKFMLDAKIVCCFSQIKKVTKVSAQI